MHIVFAYGISTLANATQRSTEHERSPEWSWQITSLALIERRMDKKKHLQVYEVPVRAIVLVQYEVLVHPMVRKSGLQGRQEAQRADENLDRERIVA